MDDVLETVSVAAAKPAVPPGFPAVLVKLYKGPIYRDRHPREWQSLLTHLTQVKRHFVQIGVDVVLAEDHGYAFLRNGDDPEIPSLVVPHQFSYPVSLMCILLTRRLKEHDASGRADRLVVRRELLFAEMAPFFPNSTNEAKLTTKLDAALRGISEAGLIEEVTGEPGNYSIRRIIEALFTADLVGEIEAKLRDYAAYASQYNLERGGRSRKRRAAGDDAALDAAGSDNDEDDEDAND